MRRPPVALLALALAACNTNPAGTGALFHGPVSVAVFNGFTHRHLGETKPRPYIAVASYRTDELRLVDPLDNVAIPSPAFAFPLSIPTAPMPIKVAAASLQDMDGSDPLPDLLVVASAGVPSLEVVSTWLDPTTKLAHNEVVATVDLSAAAGAGAEILSLVGLAPPTPPGTTSPIPPAPYLVPGTARILAGVSGGRLVVVDFQRGAGGAVALKSGSAPVAQTLGFDPVDMALGPDGVTVYCATPGVIAGSIQGVAAVTTILDATLPWTITALKAGPVGTNGKPTRLVAAAMVGERTASSADTFSTAAPRVYAALDPSGCGVQQEISCGIVTLDPTLDPAQTNLAPDIASFGGSVPLQGYRAPFILPAQPMALAIALPPSPSTGTTPQRCDPPYSACAPVTAQDGKPLLLLAPGSGQRWTTAAMVVGASDGVSYVVDLGRGSAPGDVSLLNGDTRTRAVSASFFIPPGSAQVGLWPDVTAPGAAKPVTDSTLVSNVQVTPGYTQSDTWTITYQGVLPGLANRTAILALSGSTYSVSLAGPGNISDPALGVEVGDFVQVAPLGGSSCETTVSASGGGMLTLATAPCLPPPGLVTINVLAHDLVATGAATGYIGRPKKSTVVGQVSDSFQLAWSSPEDAISRKARRIYYSVDPPCAAAGCYVSFPQMVDPLATGPALVFRVGEVTPNSTSPPLTLQRLASLTFTTQSGVQPMARAPVAVSLPSAALAFDHSGISATDGVLFYLTYLGDTLMEFPPYASAASVASIR